MAKQLTSQSTKQAEIETLARWHSEAGEQTYLASLLSEEACTFIVGQIRNDFLCDIYSMYKSAVVSAGELKANSAQLKATIDAMTDDIVKLQVLLEETSKTNTANYKAYLGTHERMSSYSITVAKQSIEITQLKAKLWDLTQEE